MFHELVRVNVDVYLGGVFTSAPRRQYRHAALIPLLFNILFFPQGIKQLEKKHNPLEENTHTSFGWILNYVLLCSILNQGGFKRHHSSDRQPTLISG